VDDEKKDEDIIEILASHGDRSIVRRTKKGESDLVELSPVKDGEPIDPAQDLFTLEAREGEPRRYNVKTLYEGKKGPTRASTKQYRQGWDNIFGKRKTSTELN
jgi:hypothetical protein